MKKKQIPDCPKRVSGKHKFSRFRPQGNNILCSEYPVCWWCGMVNDTVKSVPANTPVSLDDPEYKEACDFVNGNELIDSL